MVRRNKALLRIDRLYGRGLILMEKDIAQIEDYMALENNKLPSNYSKDLRDYIKLLGEMKEAQEKIQSDKAQAVKAEKEAKDKAALDAMSQGGM